MLATAIHLAGNVDNSHSRKRDPFGVTIGRIREQISHKLGVIRTLSPKGLKNVAPAGTLVVLSTRLGEVH